jgi:hypothetical protein
LIRTINKKFKKKKQELLVREKEEEQQISRKELNKIYNINKNNSTINHSLFILTQMMLLIKV